MTAAEPDYAAYILELDQAGPPARTSWLLVAAVAVGTALVGVPATAIAVLMVFGGGVLAIDPATADAGQDLVPSSEESLQVMAVARRRLADPSLPVGEQTRLLDRLATELFNANRLAEAVGPYERLIEIGGPSHRVAAARLGYCESIVGDPADATRHCRSVLDGTVRDPLADGLAHAVLGQLASSEGRPTDAIAAFDAAAELLAADHWVMSDVLLGRGLAHERLDRLEAAAADFATLFERVDEWAYEVEASLGQARVLDRLGRPDEAVAALDWLLEADPETDSVVTPAVYADMLWHRADLLDACGEFDEAAEDRNLAAEWREFADEVLVDETRD